MNNPGKDSHKIISPLELKKTVNLALVLALERVRKGHLFFALSGAIVWLSQLGDHIPPQRKKRCHFLICPREIPT